MTLRAKVNYEECPQSDWLEQWDTAEKYYGGCPECPECGCGMDYVRDNLWQCSDNEEEYSGGCSAALLEWKGNDKGGQAVNPETKETIPFDEYKQTYGDPNNYVYLYAIIESKCDHCGEWGLKDSLTGIDFYEPAPDHWETGTFTEPEVDAMPEGYLRETLQGMLENVKEEAA